MENTTTKTHELTPAVKGFVRATLIELPAQVKVDLTNFVVSRVYLNCPFDMAGIPAQVARTLIQAEIAAFKADEPPYDPDLAYDDWRIESAIEDAARGL
ncbi:MAG: hypothetical protein ACYTFZ_09615 [Planctomycetota bacterium]